mmetsp:Transcript_15964/g.24735  ORF Transcript_15964/g.24735 Transcript_15964/m.24735 type:complete len:104 (-) Transcript_15964:3289-3600(-)
MIDLNGRLNNSGLSRHEAQLPVARHPPRTLRESIASNHLSIEQERQPIHPYQPEPYLQVSESMDAIDPRRSLESHGSSQIIQEMDSLKLPPPRQGRDAYIITP